VRSWLVDIDGPVHVADFGGTGPTVILLHGLGGSHANWLAVGARLSRMGRVLCPDLPGFGRTRLAGRKSSLEANERLVDRLLDLMGHPPAILVGNSMGATIALRLAAAHPLRIAALALMAPWVPLPRLAGPVADPALRTILESPSAVRALLRAQGTRTPDATLRQIIKIGCVRPDRIPPEVLAAARQIARERALLSRTEDGVAPAVSSLIEFTRHSETLPMSIGSIKASTLVMQGTEDRVVPPSVIQRLRQSRPDWTYHMLEGVGHVPQFEVPIQVADTIIDWAHNGYVPQVSAT
jgi:pimeloyl-ACP methyl ester carboxylesterase